MPSDAPQITSEEIDRRVEGVTVPSAFLRTVDEHGDLVALRDKQPDGSWREFTFRDYAEKVARVAGAMRAMGVGRGDRVVMMLRNIPEFHFVDMAACFLGATPISIYNSSAPEQIEYLVNHSEAVWAFVEDVGFLERFLKVRSELTNLRNLGILRDPDGLAPSDVFGWEQLEGGDPIDLEAAAGEVTPEMLATVIYTSGTTGPPKGVMISHYNVAWTVESLKIAVQEHPAFTHFAGKRIVSYLPMAHIAERVTSHYQGAFLGYEVTTCPEPTMIAEYLREVRPNFVFGVPRVWEKIYAGVNAALAADPERKKQFDDGIAAALELVPKVDWGTATKEEMETWEFLKAVFGQARELIGLDQCELAVTGAAPIPADILRWFRALGVDLTEIYGMSECTGPMTWRAIKVKPGTVGIAIPGCEVKLAEDGEICCRGGNVFQGYLKDPEKTAEALDEEGWLHSGDIGEVDEDGYFRIVDRKKELIITAGGKNVSPANLEAALKTIPLVGQACAVGDGKPFVAALVTLDPEVAPAWARQQGIEFETLEDLAKNPAVVAEIEKGVEEVMRPFSNAERVKKVTVIGEEWLPDSDVLTPTAKLKRRGIHARYAELIEALYSG
ncbi:MAG: putative fatty-acid-CoA ligase FadD [Acidimicrobiales bacterium]|nr:MAG: putative fatty-acid-CoA ligase FadD [Acidimicrobiales bacterium]